ncbi:hypothetical protein MLD38_003761 [Melastoma candidum]|uniref:Uncharacterized protein n=1 Tax=Melastoma candidum TaxID=119954 RepID=A0ACB9S3B1_9MYRT|nr:hypothetical protein MLD38_003761 [Melastoma candidum]
MPFKRVWGGESDGGSGSGKSMFKEMQPLLHLLFSLCIHWVAEEMTVSVIVDVATAALCTDDTTCSAVIYITGLEATVVGIFKMFVLPVLGHLADDYGRKKMLIITSSTSMFPFALLAINQSKGFVYAFYALRTISYIMSQGSVLYISVAYAADVVDTSKRAIAFAWITGFLSASHVIGNLLARFLPEKYIFAISVCLLAFASLYMVVFLRETVKCEPSTEEQIKLGGKIVRTLQKRYRSMKESVQIIMKSPTLRGISMVSFFYKLGMIGVGDMLFYYLKAVFGYTKNQFSEILMVVEGGAIVSQMVLLPIANAFVGEKVVLCSALLAAVVYATLYGVAWASWVSYFSASFGVVYILVAPATFAIISKASSSEHQGKAQGAIAGVEALAGFLSPLFISPLTTWFLSDSAPFDCKGFSILTGAFCMFIGFIFACLLKTESVPTEKSSDVETPEDQVTPLLDSSSS